ncbi:MAG: helix-turn-helix domain-containing protein [Bacilli bacterium]|jgi:transcriptional regulator with XRE-family HTH domain
MLGKRLKELRVSKSLSQQRLGELVNVTKVSICCYELGKRTPNLETIKDLANVFNVSIDYLVGNDIQVDVIKEDSEEYKIILAHEDVKIIKELKSNHNLYKKITEDPKRFITLMKKWL